MVKEERWIAADGRIIGATVLLDRSGGGDRRTSGALIQRTRLVTAHAMVERVQAAKSTAWPGRCPLATAMRSRPPPAR